MTEIAKNCHILPQPSLQANNHTGIETSILVARPLSRNRNLSLEVKISILVSVCMIWSRLRQPYWDQAVSAVSHYTRRGLGIPAPATAGRGRGRCPGRKIASRWARLSPGFFLMYRSLCPPKKSLWPPTC